jgi:hypothetical protein
MRCGLLRGLLGGYGLSQSYPAFILSSAGVSRSLGGWLSRVTVLTNVEANHAHLREVHGGFFNGGPEALKLASAQHRADAIVHFLNNKVEESRAMKIRVLDASAQELTGLHLNVHAMKGRIF